MAGGPGSKRATVWLGKDAAGTEISGVGDPFAQATEGRLKNTAASGPLRFQTQGGRTVLPKNADESTLVLDSSGEVISDLGSLLQAGLIEADGLTYRMVGQAAGTEGQTQGDQEVNPQDIAERAVPLADQQAETLVQHLQANHAQLYAGLAEIMSDVNFSGLVPAHLLESTAGQLGVSTEQARDTLAYVAREFQQQAIRYILVKRRLTSGTRARGRLGGKPKAKALNSSQKVQWRKLCMWIQPG